jgi:DnaJ-class molecular chaperone
MQQRDPYEVLGVARTASQDEIKQAYRRYARAHHPDVNPEDAEAEERFKQISFAKEMLVDDEKRRLYDEFGFDGLAVGFDPEQARSYREWARRADRSPQHDFFSQGASDDAGLDNLLSQLFGAGAGTSKGFAPFSAPEEFGTGHPRRGVDFEPELEVDFLDAIRGGEVRMQLEGRDPLRVRIPVGTRDGARIRLAGQGAPAAPGGKAGDLFLRLRVRPHPFYRREGDDLHVDVPVTLPELILGAEIQVPTPEGPVQMKLPPRSDSGRRMRLRGKGVAKRAADQFGDLYVRLVVTLPESGDEQLDELAHKLEPFYADRDVRARLREAARR